MTQQSDIAAELARHTDVILYEWHNGARRDTGGLKCICKEWEAPRDSARGIRPLGEFHEHVAEAVLKVLAATPAEQDIESEAHSRYYPRGIDGRRISGRSPYADIFIEGARYGLTLQQPSEKIPQVAPSERVDADIEVAVTREWDAGVSKYLRENPGDGSFEDLTLSAATAVYVSGMDKGWQDAWDEAR